MMSRVPVIVLLTVVWSLLWGAFTPLIVVGGVLVALLVTTVFPFPPITWTGRIRPWPLTKLIGIFFFEMLLASVQVAWIAIRPAKPPRSAVLCVDLATRSELLLTLTAELISLVPGTLLIELDSQTGHIWLHLLDGSTPEKIERARANALAQELRVIEALGSESEIVACRAGDQS
ncbi:Na+/H+ antiporter subunit E [Aeromicrobium wangtongii]|uniref:Na+/H+ antiporter subunit E n=1 Tax=Aeromicrobium wangtongii TaxID=2969247 RepID=A0ABY5M9I2_9ACTN|nr:Na+/H+ antiporter subunit E [Aeromicrobium wangtongii]MCD9199753.1 Na+/H+ antiporter subunit E [Aeromicrobium wangtongii]UUP14102.1 Na+/H+ antiporter subunit E [Aeromicrobium wangtongii]